MSVSNPAPAQLGTGDWSVTGGPSTLVVNIPSEPADNDLSGIIILGKVGSGQTLSYPADVFYKGKWQEFITIDTDASNAVLAAETTYTLSVAAYDEFGDTDSTFSATKNATTSVVTEVNTDPTGTTKRTEISPSGDGETHFYGNRGDGTIEELASIGIRDADGSDDTVLKIGSENLDFYAIYGISKFDQRTIRGVNVGTGKGVEGSNNNTGADSTGTGVKGAAVKIGIDLSGPDVRGVHGEVTHTGGTYTGTNARRDVAGVYGEVFAPDGGDGAGVVGKAPYDYGLSRTRTLVDGSAAFYSEAGDCDFRSGVVYVGSYTVSTLPSASIAAGLIYVSNETGGAVMAFSDGTNWRRVTDRAVVA